MSRIRIEILDITVAGMDCVVNAANSGLWEGGGICGAIFRAAGSPVPILNIIVLGAAETFANRLS